MRIINRNHLCFLTLITISLCGKDVALNLADRFFGLEFYDEAITEYKRYIHFNVVGEEVSYAYYKIGLAYRNKHNLKKSLEALEASAQASTRDSIREERKIDIAVTYIAEGRYDKAKIILLKLLSFSNFSEVKRKASLFLCIANLYTYQWESAKDAIGIYFEEEGHSVFAEELDSFLSAAEDMNYKSPTTAKWLSTFIPGTGQMYAGNVGDGVNAFLLNGANIYFIIYKLLKKEYGNAYIIYFFLFRRYYFGNIYRAKKEAFEYNRKLNEHTADSVLTLLKRIEE
jgi:TM2 domain-containing membrane protein YozV